MIAERVAEHWTRKDVIMEIERENEKKSHIELYEENVRLKREIRGLKADMKRLQHSVDVLKKAYNEKHIQLLALVKREEEISAAGSEG